MISCTRSAPVICFLSFAFGTSCSLSHSYIACTRLRLQVLFKKRIGFLLYITVSRPMNCVARKMWGIHDAVRAQKARRHFRFSLTSIPNIPKRDFYGCPSRPWKDNRSNCYCGNVRKMLPLLINAGCRGNENCSTRNTRKIFRLLQRKLRATAAWEYT